MENNEIVEGNGIIVEFMGLTIYANGMCEDPTKGVLSPSFGLKYNSSWDWLMPVVEKIETTERDDIKHIDFSLDCGGWIAWLKGRHGDQNMPQWYVKDDVTKIESVWQAVVAFIKWYNKDHPSQPPSTTKAD